MKKRLISLALALVLTLGLLPGTAMAAWPSFRGNSENLGVTIARTPTKNYAKLAWAAKIGSLPEYVYAGQPVVDGGYVYVTAGQTLYKLNAQDGSVAEKQTMPGMDIYGTTPPTIDAGTIYVALQEGKVAAFSKDTLELKWVTRSLSAQGQNSCPVLVSGGRVYTGFHASETGTQKFVCLDAKDKGRLIWSYESAGGFYWAGAVAVGSYIFVGTDDGTAGTTGTSRILSFSKSQTNGTPAAELKLPGLGDQRSSLAYSKETGRIYFTTKGGYLCSAKVNGQTGKFSALETCKLSLGSTSTPVYYHGYIYVGEGTGEDGANGYLAIVKENAETGALEMVKELEMPGSAQGSPLLSTAYEKEDGAVYLYDSFNYPPGGLVCIRVNAKDPSKTKQKDDVVTIFGDKDYAQYCTASPVCGDDGTIYFSNNSGYLFAVSRTDAPVAVITTQPQSATYKPGADVKPLTVTAKPTEGAKISACQWEKSSDGTNWTDIDDATKASWTDTDGATKASYTPKIPAELDEPLTTYYRCVVTTALDGKTAEIASKAAVITVKNTSSDTSISYVVTNDNAIPDTSVYPLVSVPSSKKTVTLNSRKLLAQKIDKPRVWFKAPEDGTLTVDLSDCADKAVLNTDRCYPYSGYAVFSRGITQTNTICVTATAEDGTVTEYTFVISPDGQEPDITVTFSLLGDTAHGADEGVHTLAGGSLTPWIAETRVTVPADATVLNVIEQATTAQTDAAYRLETSKNKNYISAITRTEAGSSVRLAEFGNGNYSGWMYTLNGKHSDTAVNQQTLQEGDVIVLHYTDDYKKETGMGYTPKDVIALIEKIDEVTSQSGSAIDAARSAYNSLSDEDKAKVTNYRTLLDAEEQYRNLSPAVDWKTAYQQTGTMLLSQVLQGSWDVGSVSGEWLMLGLARSGQLNGSDVEDYIQALESFVTKNINSSGQIRRGNDPRSTENSRVALAATALGYDARDFAGCNLLSALKNTTWVTQQGNAATAFAILALHAKTAYLEEDASLQNAAEALAARLLKNQNSDGGWASTTGDSDPDATAMALTALAKDQTENEKAADAILKGLSYLADHQLPSGAIGTTAETSAQVLVALSALRIDAAKDARFIRDGKTVLDGLLQYYLDGGFYHSASDRSFNQMAAEQAYYALAAYERLTSGNAYGLYDMDDVKQPEDAALEDIQKELDALGEIKSADRDTYVKLETIRQKIRRLKNDADKERMLAALQEKQDAFDEILKDAKYKAWRETLSGIYDEVYDAAKKEDPSLLTEEAIQAMGKVQAQAEKDIMAASHTDEIASILKKAKTDLNNALHSIKVSFRLIGDFLHEERDDEHTGYVTWIETKTYALSAGSTVKDLLEKALDGAELRETGADKGYVSAIMAPEALGGYWLSEMDNGANSGWMYTVNGEHPDQALGDFTLEAGDKVIWHYVDDYTTEADAATWLRAVDISPEQYAKEKLSDIVRVVGRGSVSPTLSLSQIGSDVTFTFQPDTNHRLLGVTVDGKSVGTPESYTYQNLTLNSRIKATFTGVMRFLDVRREDWFYKSVRYVVEQGLFQGTTQELFSPHAPMTRGMLVTVLYRLAGSPEVTESSEFSDVAADKYYASAVSWAAESGIVSGMSAGSFAPDAQVTREQLAAILYRYAREKRYDTSKSAELEGFSDYSRVSAYAVEGLSWANAAGLVNGRSETELSPQGSATRAEVAAILYRFAENVAKK